MSDEDRQSEAALRAEVEQSRTELARTVEALAAKTDLTARATHAAAQAVARVRSIVSGWRIWPRRRV